MRAFLTSLLIVLLLFTGCQVPEGEELQAELLKFPALDWGMTREEIIKKYPGGTERQHGYYDNVRYYDVDRVQLWGDELSLSFEFIDEDLMTLWAHYADPDEDAVKEKVRAAYGSPWKEYGWQKGVNRWRSEEKIIDRLTPETVLQYKEALIHLPLGNYHDRYDYLDTLYQFISETPLVKLGWDSSTNCLTWRVAFYPAAARLSGYKTPGKVSLDTLLQAAKGGRESYTPDGFLQEVRMSLTAEELEELKKQFGPSNERYFTYDMPEGSLFGVSKEQVLSSFDDEGEKSGYLSLLGNRGLTQTKQEIYAEMYRTPLAKVYWQAESRELVWDLTGNANLQKVRSVRS